MGWSNPCDRRSAGLVTPQRQGRRQGHRLRQWTHRSHRDRCGSQAGGKLFSHTLGKDGLIGFLEFGVLRPQLGIFRFEPGHFHFRGLEFDVPVLEQTR